MEDSIQQSSRAYEQRLAERMQETERRNTEYLRLAEKQNSDKLRSAEQQNALRLNAARRPNEEKLAQAEKENQQRQEPKKNSFLSKLKNPAGTAKKIAGIAKSPFWIIALACGIGCDLADVIPVGGWLITFFARPFLTIFLLFHGTWGRKAGRTFLLILDFVPIIGFIPFSTACVVDAYLKAQDKK